MPPKASQETLRRLFQQWGLPERVRLDNGHPWGSSGDLPPALALWLLGLGIGLIYNPARRPQRNCFVERLQGLAEPWAEPESCASVAEYQANLDWAIRVQREEYPSIASPLPSPLPSPSEAEHGKANGQAKAWRTRLKAYPELTVVRRPFDPLREAETWSLKPVKAYLAEGCWRRKVNKVGRITIYRRALHVGRAYCHREVLVVFDPLTTEWVVQAANGHVLARHQASEITAARDLRPRGQQPPEQPSVSPLTQLPGRVIDPTLQHATLVPRDVPGTAGDKPQLSAKWSCSIRREGEGELERALEPGVDQVVGQAEGLGQEDDPASRLLDDRRRDIRITWVTSLVRPACSISVPLNLRAWVQRRRLTVLARIQRNAFSPSPL